MRAGSMPRPYGRYGKWLALVVACCGMFPLGFAASARADVDPRAMAAALEAIAQFKSKSNDYLSGQQPMPMLGAAGPGPSLDVVWNMDAVVAGRPQHAAGVSGLLDWLSGASLALKHFMSAGNARTMPEMAANYVKYHKEMAFGSAFLWRLSATLMQAIGDHLSKLPPEEANSPVRKQGLAKVTSGLKQQAVGILMQLDGAEIEDARLMSSALAADVGEVSRYLDEEARKAILASADSALPKQKDESVRRSIEQFAAVLRQP